MSNYPNPLSQELDATSDAADNHAVAFSKFYDQYAPVLLGIITKIVGNEAEAITVLEATFMKVHADINHFRSGNQPVFVGLLTIARSMAIERLKKRVGSGTPSLHLNAAMHVTTTTELEMTTSLPTQATAEPASIHLNELLNKVLFKNCTPEEAASSVGLSAERARQHLRLAIQQLRSMPTP